MAIATDGSSIIGRLSFLAQKLEAKIVSWVTVHCHAHRLVLASYYTAAELCVRNCKNILMQIWKCFLTLRLAGLAMHQTTMKTKGWQLQRACKTTWLSSEATLRARCEILGIRAALKQLSENKNDAMCVVLLQL